jgi:hypothetical protein
MIPTPNPVRTCRFAAFTVVSLLVWILSAATATAEPALRVGEAHEVGDAKTVSQHRAISEVVLTCTDTGRCVYLWEAGPKLRYSVLDRDEQSEPVAYGVLGEGLASPQRAAVAAGDDRFVAAWCDGDNVVWAQEIALDDGLLLGESTRVSADDEPLAARDCRHPQVAVANDNYLVAWSRSDADAEPDTHSFARWMGADGTP